MIITKDDFLTDNLIKDCFNLSIEYDDLDLIIEDQEDGLYCCKTSIPEDIAMLDYAGFDLITTNLNYRFGGDRKELRSLFFCREYDINFNDYMIDIMAIAKDSFKHDRFHRDRRIPNYLADLVKAMWVLNYMTNRRGDSLLLSFRDGKPVGFLGAMVNGSIAYIDLIAVDKEYRCKGIGRELVESFLFKYRDYDNLMVSTQDNNVESRELYKSVGFKLDNTNYTFHLHKE